MHRQMSRICLLKLLRNIILLNKFKLTLLERDEKSGTVGCLKPCDTLLSQVLGRIALAMAFQLCASDLCTIDIACSFLHFCQEIIKNNNLCCIKIISTFS